MQRHNFSFRADCQPPRSSSRGEQQSPRFNLNKENERSFAEGRLDRLLNHNQQLLVENEKLAVRAGEIQLLRQSNAELQRNNSHLRESLRLVTLELQSQQNAVERARMQSETERLKLKNDMVVLAKKLEEAQARCKAHEAAVLNYKQQEERRLTIMAERLTKMEKSIDEHEHTIAQLKREKEQCERQLEQERSQNKYEVKRLEEELKEESTSLGRQISILREELQKKGLQLVYHEKLSEEETKKRESEFERVSSMLKEKQDEQLQAVEIIRMLESEKERVLADYQHLLQKLRNLQKNLQQEYSHRQKQLQQAYESRIDNYKRQAKQLQRTNRQLKESLEGKVDEAESMRQTLQQMSVVVKQLKKKCQELNDKHTGLERNFEDKLAAQRNKLRESYELVINSRRKDQQVRQALANLEDQRKFLSPGSASDVSQERQELYPASPSEDD